MYYKCSRKGTCIYMLLFLFFFGLLLFCGKNPLYGMNIDPSVTLHRFALIIGSNYGGKERVILRYATRDAHSFANVMKNMGAVYDDNIIILLNPGIEEILSAFGKMRKKVDSYRGIPGRKEFVIYYSGHSDEEGLLLFGEKLSYMAFRDEISSVKAEVRVAILDSCSSGAFTRTKGIIRQPPFLVDSSSKMEGYAFLTSSAENEAAQESDSIKASFFTHYLVSGLHGAADISGDGLVTLNEVYSYAFSETLARTETTQHGPQHPKYDIQLTGTGDLVLTDLRETSASLLLGNEMEGRIYVRDSSGNLIVELRKIHGNTVQLGLEPGRYEITKDQYGNLSKGYIRLKKNDRKLLSSTELENIHEEESIARGNDIIADHVPGKNQGKRKVIRPVHFSLFPLFSRSGFLDSNYTYIFSPNLLLGAAANITGGQISTFGNIVKYNMYGIQGASLFNYVEGTTYGFQGSGIGNITLGEVYGFQGSGIFNYGGSSVRFIQGPSLINIAAGEMTGIQGAVIANYASGVTGFQGAGLLNMSTGMMKGIQGAGFLNVAEGDVYGLQIGGIGNIALISNGSQLSSIINITGQIYGFQGGLINIADEVTGVQLGLFNYSNKYTYGFPIGLINIEKNGGISLDAWYNESGYTNLGIRLKTQFTYSLFSGAITFNSDPVLWSYGLGWGLYFPFFSMFSWSSDVSCHFMYTGDKAWGGKENKNFLPRIRGLLGVNVNNTTIFAGYMCNIYIPGLYFDVNTDECLKLDIPYVPSIYIKPQLVGGISFSIF